MTEATAEDRSARADMSLANYARAVEAGWTKDELMRSDGCTSCPAGLSAPSHPRNEREC